MDAAFHHAQALYDAAEPDWIEEDEMPTTAHTVAASLSELVSELTYLDPEDVVATFSADVSGLIGSTVSTYEEAGVLTRDAGFIVRMEDGTEYQVTVVRSR
jgi:hypothetical protein